MASLTQYAVGIGLFVVIFAVIGIGLGLTGYITVDFGTQMFGSDGESQSEGGGGMQQAFASLFVLLVLFQSAIIVFFAGPIVAGFAGAIAGIVTPETGQGVVIGGVGSFVGFYPMAVLALVLTFLAFDTGTSGGSSSGGSSISLGKMIGVLLIGGAPTGVVGALTGALGSKL